MAKHTNSIFFLLGSCVKTHNLLLETVSLLTHSRSSPKSPQVTLALALCGSAAAYVAPAAKSAGVAMSASKADMADLAEANPDFLGSSLGLWDPLGAFPRPPRSGPPPAARVPPLTPSLP